MKLLMITGLGSALDLASGKRGAFYNMLEEFHKYWDRIDIITPKIRNPKSEILFGNVFIHISPWPLIFHPVWFLKKALEIYKEHKFNLMIVHEFPPFYNGLGARLLWQKIKVPYILEIHHVPGYPKAANFKETFYKWLTRIFIKLDSAQAKAIRVVNKKQTPEFLVKAGIKNEKIIFIPSLYIDSKTFKPLDLQKEYDLIFVGRLAENKGLNLLLEAVKIIKPQIPDIKCLIVGDGPERKNLEFRINNLGLKNEIFLYGWAKDSQEVAELLNKSKILIMPSYNEGGPRVILEALAAGVPVLATSVGVVTDVIKDRESGRIIDWRADDIAAKAKELLFDNEEYDKYRLAGLAIAKKFEKEEVIKNYAEKLKSIL